jgi:hypothetical protein
MGLTRSFHNFLEKFHNVFCLSRSSKNAAWDALMCVRVEFSGTVHFCTRWKESTPHRVILESWHRQKGFFGKALWSQQGSAGSKKTTLELQILTRLNNSGPLLTICCSWTRVFAKLSNALGVSSCYHKTILTCLRVVCGILDAVHHWPKGHYYVDSILTYIIAVSQAGWAWDTFWKPATRLTDGNEHRHGICAAVVLIVTNAFWSLWNISEPQSGFKPGTKLLLWVSQAVSAGFYRIAKGKKTNSTNSFSNVSTICTK